MSRSRRNCSPPVRSDPWGGSARWTADHVRTVAVAWVVVAVALGAFAPRVGTRALGRRLGGVGIRSRCRRAGSCRRASAASPARRSWSSSTRIRRRPPTRRSVRCSPRSRHGFARATRSPPSSRRRPGASVSRDGHTAIVTAGASGTPTEAVAAADELKHDAGAARQRTASRSRSRAPPGCGRDFNEANKEAMLKSELISWPVTLAILVLAFGSLVAAGLPLLLTILGLVASAGLLWRADARLRHLDLGDELRAHVRARARDRLRALRRPPLPRRLLRLAASRARGRRRDDGHRRQGRPLLRPDRADLALGGDARPEPGVPLDGARDHAQRRLRPRSRR